MHVSRVWYCVVSIWLKFGLLKDMGTFQICYHTFYHAFPLGLAYIRGCLRRVPRVTVSFYLNIGILFSYKFNGNTW